MEFTVMHCEYSEGTHVVAELCVSALGAFGALQRRNASLLKQSQDTSSMEMKERNVNASCYARM